MLAHSHGSPCPQVEADKFQQLPDNLCSEKARTDPHPTDKIIEQDELSFKEVTWRQPKEATISLLQIG